MQTDILAKANQFKHLQDIIIHAKAFETALSDQSKFHSSEIHAFHTKGPVPPKSNTYSSFSSTSTDSCNNFSFPRKANIQKKCSGCGSTAHSHPGSNDCTTKCPAWGKTCHNCQKLNHFANVCQQLVNVNGINLVAHVSYNDCDETFTVASTANIKEIPASLTPIINNQKQQQSTQMLIYPDSSAQICLAGPKHLSKLHISNADLIPTNKQIVAVGRFKLDCKGWLLTEFQIQDKNTTQPLFICNKVD